MTAVNGKDLPEHEDFTVQRIPQCLVADLAITKYNGVVIASGHVHALSLRNVLQHLLHHIGG